METKISTQDVLQRCLALLLKDARVFLEDPEFMLGAESVNRQRLDETNYICHPKRFKARYQVQNLFKRFIMRDEAGKLDELESGAVAKFAIAQERINEFLQRPLPARTYKVLQTARSYIKQVLKEDPYSRTEEYRWGRRAAVNVPYRDSYLDSRIKHLSGSAAHINWFREFTKDDELLISSLCIREDVELISHLAAGFVPKSWKALRMILKNSNIGSFHSAGIGNSIVVLWREFGYDLNSRSEKHGRWIQPFSVDLSHVTMDMVSASDLYCTTIIRWLLPYRWYRACMLGHTPYVDLDGSGNKSRILSVMTMGVGYTFPLQSLCFYAILKAIKDLSKTSGLISVFGDDLIFPTKMHHIVCGVFRDLNFMVNEEKTFVKQEFRESCGRDYYCGRDVRPFMPEGFDERLSGTDLRVFLHKTLNGFQRRWPTWEIPSVVAYLESLLYEEFGPIYQVPGDFPDTAGVKTPFPAIDSLYAFPEADDNGSFRFRCLLGSVPKRDVLQTRIYYWESLRSAVGSVGCSRFDSEVDNPVLSWRKSKGSIRRRKEYIEKHRLPRKYIKEEIPTYERVLKPSRYRLTKCTTWRPLHLSPVEKAIPPFEFVGCVAEKGVQPRYLDQTKITPHWSHLLLNK